MTKEDKKKKPKKMVYSELTAMCHVCNKTYPHDKFSPLGVCEYCHDKEMNEMETSNA